MEVAPARLAAVVSPEDRARGDFYALFARLYAAPPDTALLGAIACAGELPGEDTLVEGDLSRSWHGLIDASATISADAATSEYAQLFVGVGRSEVSLHATSYAKPGDANALLGIRSALANLGLGRKTGVNLYEDHLAALCETMRVLIGATGTPDQYGDALAKQREFFRNHIDPWANACCIAITDNPVANYYRRVAQLTGVFLAIERDSFAIE